MVLNRTYGTACEAMMHQLPANCTSLHKQPEICPWRNQRTAGGLAISTSPGHSARPPASIVSRFSSFSSSFTILFFLWSVYSGWDSPSHKLQASTVCPHSPHLPRTGRDSSIAHPSSQQSSSSVWPLLAPLHNIRLVWKPCRGVRP